MKRIQCTVTKRWNYVTDERYAKLVEKYGSEEKLVEGYMCRDGAYQAKTGQVREPKRKNMVTCSITGFPYSISTKTYSEMESKGLLGSYVCRVAKKLLAEGKTADEIREMVANGTFPENKAGWKWKEKV